MKKSKLDKLREECGIFGISNHEDASALVALGLHALQHRGQEGCGIILDRSKGQSDSILNYQTRQNQSTKDSSRGCLANLSNRWSKAFKTVGLFWNQRTQFEGIDKIPLRSWTKAKHTK